MTDITTPAQRHAADTYQLFTRTEYLDEHVEAEHWVCLPISKLGRDLRAGDCVHARWTKSEWQFFGTVRESKRGLVVKPDGIADLPLADCEIQGLVVQRQQVFRV